MRPEAAMVFAAGKGTRMGTVSDLRPKALTPVLGRTLLDRALDMVADAGIARAVVNTHHLAGMVSDHLAARALPVTAVSHEARILDTGGGLKQALPLLACDPVATISAKVVWDGPNPLSLLSGAWQPGMEALLLLVPTDAALGHGGTGDFFLSDGRPERRGAAAAAPFVYASAQILRTDAVADAPDAVFSLNRIWDAMIARGSLHALVYPGRWAAIESPASLSAADALAARA
jgi:MurNAc alpha-1-phosphate uridylyltransferase